MTAPVQATAVAAGCVKGDRNAPCPGRPIVRYAVGPVCSGHQVAGAQILEWLVDAAALEPAAVAEAFRSPAPTPPVAPLPDPSRPTAAVHADATAGESHVARLVAYRAGTIRAHVLMHLVDAGPHGTTAIEAWNWYRANHSPTTERYSIAPRLSELVADGWAIKTGRLRNVRGPGCAPEEIYVLSPRGRRQRGLSW